MAGPAIDFDGIQAAITAWVVAGSGLDDQHVTWGLGKGGQPTRPYIDIEASSIYQASRDWETRAANVVTFADLVVTADPDTGELATTTPHGRTTGDGPTRLTTTGTTPDGTAIGTDYWLVVVDATHLKLCDSFTHTGGNHAGNPITTLALGSTGTGTLKLVATATTVAAGKELLRRVQGFREIAIRMQCFGPEGSGLLPMSILSDVVASLPLHIDALDAAGVGMSELGVAETESPIRMVEGRRGSILEPRAVLDIYAYVGSELNGTLGRIDHVQVTPRVTLEDGGEATLPSTWIPDPP